MTKILILLNKITLICEIQEIINDSENDPDCKIIKPYELVLDENSDSTILKKWMPFTIDNELLIRSKNILTIADPTPEIVEKYLELTA